MLGAVALLLVPGAAVGFDVGVAVALVALYTLVSRVEFPVGAGYVVPTQLVLVPMLVLLPPATVPLLVAAGLVLARLSDLAAPPRLRRCDCSSRSPTPGTPSARRSCSSSPARRSSTSPNLPLLGAALLCGCLFDAGSATLREAAARGIAPSCSSRSSRTS